MGSTFFSNLIRLRVQNAINLGINVLNQCSTTLSSDFQCQDCPGTIQNGISFDSTQVITLDCISGPTIETQIHAVIRQFLLSLAQMDVKFGFPVGEFPRYLEETENLANQLSVAIINTSKQLISTFGLFCRFENSEKVFYIDTFELENSLQNQIPNQASVQSSVQQLLQSLSLTQTNRIKNQDAIVIVIISLILFFLALVLLPVISCGYIIVILIVILLAILLIINGMT